MRRSWLSLATIVALGCSGGGDAGGVGPSTDAGSEVGLDAGDAGDARLALLAAKLDRIVAEGCREAEVGAPIDQQAYVEIGLAPGAEPFFARVPPTGKGADAVQVIASASKWPAAVAIVEALSDPTGAGTPSVAAVTSLRLAPKSKSPDGFAFLAGVSPYSDVIESISLEHLLSFTSGLHVDASGGAAYWDACANDVAETDTSCAVTALSRRPTAIVPGSVFSYGSLHLEVAAAMAEERTGKTFQELVDRHVNGPLGLAGGPRLRYPRPLSLENPGLAHPNPLVAGGMRTSARSYRTFLLGVAAGSTFRAWAGVEPDRSRVEGLPRAIDPAEFSVVYDVALWGYGLGHWIQPNGIVSSPGKSGFYPWLDPTTHTWGIVGFEASDSSGWGEESAQCGLKLQAAVRACLVDGACS